MLIILPVDAPPHVFQGVKSPGRVHQNPVPEPDLPDFVGKIWVRGLPSSGVGRNVEVACWLRNFYFLWLPW